MKLKQETRDIVTRFGVADATLSSGDLAVSNRFESQPPFRFEVWL